MQMPFGNYYLLNPVENWAVPCISKNACSSLKGSVLQCAGRPLPATVLEVHDTIGYQASEFLRPVSAGPPPGMHVFAVWRDPIDRWYSAIAYLRNLEEWRLRRKILGTVDSLRLRTTLPQALAVTEHNLARSSERCDEHLRRQADYCDYASVDSVVPLRELDAFMASHGWRELPRLNEGDRKIERDDAVSAKVRELYAADYALLRS